MMDLVVPGVWVSTSVSGLIMSAGIVLSGGKPVMFSLRSSGPQEGRLSDEDRRSSECTCSSYFSDL